MLIKIKSRSQLGVIKHLPIEVFNEAKRVVTILDENYNNYNIDGGYVLIAENADDLKRIIGYYFNYTSMIYEFAERTFSLESGMVPLDTLFYCELK